MAHGAIMRAMRDKHGWNEETADDVLGRLVAQRRVRMMLSGTTTYYVTMPTKGDKTELKKWVAQHRRSHGERPRRRR